MRAQESKSSIPKGKQAVAANPYEPPTGETTAANTAPPRDNPWRLGIAILATAAITTTVGTALLFAGFPLAMYSVPVSLLLFPAVVRTLKVRQVRFATGTTGLGDLALLALASLFLAIPITAASTVVFCCVCTPSSLLTMMIDGGQMYGPTEIGLVISVFIGLAVALWLSVWILRRSSYISSDVRDATLAE